MIGETIKRDRVFGWDLVYDRVRDDVRGRIIDQLMDQVLRETQSLAVRQVRRQLQEETVRL